MARNMADYLPGGPLYGTTCVHGSLARSCELCEAADEIDRLTTELAAAKERAEMATKAINGLLDIIHDDLSHARQNDHADAIYAAKKAAGAIP